MPKVAPKKTPMPEQSAEVRKKNFDEVPLGYSEDMAVAEAERCLQCKNKPCVAGCPVEIDIPAFIKKIAERDFEASIRIMKEKNLLPAVCGRVCPQEEQCEKVCVLANKFEPVGIGRLERFIADWEAGHMTAEVPELPLATGKKVAVVGSGPAGLIVAGDLVQMGHSATIFEALHEPGGVLVYGIPEFRLPKEIVFREVDYLKKLGVEVITNFVVGRTRTVDELLEEFDAVFLGTGAGLPWFMFVPGENSMGVYSANEYLTRSNLMKAYKFPEYDTPIAKGKRVATVGGGNVAMDAARTALRLGADESIVIYRRSREEMPARDEEIERAEEEGVKFQFLTNPVAYHADGNGWVTDVECIRMELGAPDASGRRRPVEIPDSNFKTPIDTVVVAIGNSPNPLIAQTTPGLKTTRWGTVEADPETGRTSKKGVFAGGDIVTGAATVILAMGAARLSARSIDEYLKTGTW
ncbi:MAG TPA: NADPH-dependent glutamate synthase [candidate division Zixibacteria bacterium]|nr:NADPH-dependent glutamate synthase [candidate division Zixibacteria bacterium]